MASLIQTVICTAAAVAGLSVFISPQSNRSLTSKPPNGTPSNYFDIGEIGIRVELHILKSTEILSPSGIDYAIQQLIDQFDTDPDSVLDRKVSHSGPNVHVDIEPPLAYETCGTLTYFEAGAVLLGIERHIREEMLWSPLAFSASRIGLGKVAEGAFLKVLENTNPIQREELDVGILSRTATGEQQVGCVKIDTLETATSLDSTA